MNIQKIAVSAFAVAVLFSCVGCQSATKATASSSTTEASGEASSGTNPDVEVVRNGMLARYNSTTLGKALEGTFQSARWSSFDTPKGARVVQFDGTAKPDVLKEAGFNASTLVKKLISSERQRCFAESGQSETKSNSPSAIEQAQVEADNDTRIAPCMAKVLEQLAIPVKFQFILSADRKAFEIGYIDMEPFYTAGDPYSRHGFEQNPDTVLAFIYH